MEWSEALKLMRSRVREYNEVFSPEIAHGLWRLTMRSASIKKRPLSITFPVGEPLQILIPSVDIAVSDRTRALADLGDSQAFEVIKQDILVKLKSGSDLSPRERQFVAAFMEGRQGQRKRGKHAHVTAWQNFGIRGLVEYGVSLGFKEFRNYEALPISACDLVADARRAEKLSPSSHSRIKRIWIEGRSRKR